MTFNKNILGALPSRSVAELLTAGLYQASDEEDYRAFEYARHKAVVVLVFGARPFLTAQRVDLLLGGIHVKDKAEGYRIGQVRVPKALKEAALAVAAMDDPRDYGALKAFVQARTESVWFDHVVLAQDLRTPWPKNNLRAQARKKGL